MSGAQNEAAKDDDQAKTTHNRLVTEIDLYNKESQPWETKGKKILRRYKDERNPNDTSKFRYNILWSNVQTLSPALYAKNPRPNIERRFKGNDMLSGVTSDILERATDYFVNTDRYSLTMKQAVLDRLLSGRGTAWVRYVPHMRDAGGQVTDDTESKDTPTPLQEVHYEEAVSDYVHWQDFGHNVCRTWEEVYIGWRRVFLDKDELVTRFGKEKAKTIPLDHAPKGLNDEKKGEQLKKATIYEVWDKKRKRVYWIHKDVEGVLDEKDDPLRLPDFFPFPRPLLATTANDSLIPVPDYTEYQDQADELDQLTAKIASIKKSLKVVGVYDASAQGLERILAEGVENTLIPVEQWAALSEKGGMKGVMSLLPMKEIAETLLSLYEARESTKTDLYEITGMADIMRGSTDPDETATAQEIKGQYVNLRLRAQQDEVQRFTRDLVRNIAQIIAEHFSMDTIKQISSVKLLTKAEKDQLLQQQQLAAQTAQQTGKPPQDLPEEIQELLEKPTWEEVEQLLRNDALRCFRIDIETDSTINADQAQEKNDRQEFLAAAGGFMQQSMVLVEQQPELMPLIGEMLRFGVQAHKASKPLEAAFNVAINTMEKKASAIKNNPQPKPDPEMMKAQAQMELDKQKAASDAQLQQQKAEQEMAASQAKMQMEEQEAQAKLAMEEKRMEKELELKEREMLLNAKIKSRESRAKQAADSGQTFNEAPDTDLDMESNMTIKSLLDAMKNGQDQTQAAIGEMAKALTAPKRIVRDAQGRVSHAEIVNG